MDLMVAKLWAIVKLTTLHVAYCETNLLNCIYIHTHTRYTTYDVIVKRASKWLPLGHHKHFKKLNLAEKRKTVQCEYF